MTRKYAYISSVCIMFYLLAFAGLALQAHYHLNLENYYLALAKTMQATGFSFMPNWALIPLADVAPLWVWLCQASTHLVGQKLILLRIASLIATLGTIYVSCRMSMRLQMSLQVESTKISPKTLPCFTAILIALSPATAWFTFSATPWPLTTALMMTAIYTSFAFDQTLKFHFRAIYWLCLCSILLTQGLAYTWILVLLPFCWTNNQAAKQLIGYIRGWIILLVIYGAWIYMAYQSIGLSLFNSKNWLWWLVPNLGMWHQYNPFLPEALAKTSDMPVWFTVFILFPLLILLPLALHFWKRISKDYWPWIGMLLLAFYYALLIMATQDTVNALSAMQLLTPLLAIIIAPVLQQLAHNPRQIEGMLTHRSTLITALLLVAAIGLPAFHGMLPITSPALRSGLVSLIVTACVISVCARWISIRVATYVGIILIATLSLVCVWLHINHVNNNALRTLTKVVKLNMKSPDVIANVGPLRPSLWLNFNKPIIQISPLSAQISVPTTPLLVDTQQFLGIMQVSQRRAWVFIDNDDLAAHPELLNNMQIDAHAGNLLLLKESS